MQCGERDVAGGAEGGGVVEEAEGGGEVEDRLVLRALLVQQGPVLSGGTGGREVRRGEVRAVEEDGRRLWVAEQAAVARDDAGGAVVTLAESKEIEEKRGVR